MSIHSDSQKSYKELENILIIGNGGRENSLAWAIQKNELIKRIYLLPGNAGSIKINKSERINLDLSNIEELIKKPRPGLFYYLYTFLMQYLSMHNYYIHVF